MKPPTDSAWKLRRKLQALVERGVDGEQDSARKKLDRLQARYDFTQPEIENNGQATIFAGVFNKCRDARFVTAFGPNESDLATFTKWALEKGCNLSGVLRYRDDQTELYMEATAESVKGLAAIALVIRRSFSELCEQFSQVPGCQKETLKHFRIGLADGMMSDEWQTGKPLPTVTIRKPRRERTKKRAIVEAPGLSLHPYAVALELGRGIRLCTPLENVAAQLTTKIEALTEGKN